ncbi:peptidoglycan DD-metalloendopeptidase family protein [Candidatus Gracilibacteria bacterium]|nr:peptidoglycan DD-metalloendopeptidase family protein [Candidatus Gracilibacteria bacterium]
MKKIGFYLIIVGLFTFCFVNAQESYQSQEDFEDFDVKGAVKNIDDLQESVDSITKQLYELDNMERHGENMEISDKYRETRNEIVRVISDINQTTNKVSSMLKKISVYKKQILSSAEDLKTTRDGMGYTKEYIEQFTNFIYKMDNEIYNNQTDTIDDIKLLAKSDNIPRTLVGESLVKSMLLQFNDLMGNLDDDQDMNLEKIRKLNQMKIKAKDEIKDYENQLDKLQQKKNYLVKFIDLYKNRQELNGTINKVLTSRKDVHDAIMTFVDDIARKKYKASFDIDDKLKEFNKTEDESEKETAPVARPIYPVYNIENYFGDEEIQEKYGVPGRGISLKADQFTPVYSTRDGVVYHVSDTDGFGINRVMVAHMRGYISVYMYLNKIDIKEGDVIKRGQLIGYSGGEPGTKGAGFVSNGPNLTFYLFKNGIAIDPLRELDLSVVGSKNILPDEYRIKFLNDKYARPIDITNLKFASGDTKLERADDFLTRYGVGVYRELAFWEDAVKNTNIDRDVVICIAFAESTLGKYLSTSNNIGNVGNNDRGDRIGYGSAFAGARMIPLTLNNSYLGNYHTIKQLSRYGNEDGKIYASSPINRQTNVLKCLSQIKGYYVPEDYPFRTGQNPNKWDDEEKAKIMSGSTQVIKK